ncbi:S-layer homology domain-containing protein, partial [Cohnella sp. GCM10012308]|uniref:S-layer homology domain-containing protein n=1 Tax=Cohnella sp. GCM10012308 TaxID=3317329 RepID=UPI00361E31F5
MYHHLMHKRNRIFVSCLLVLAMLANLVPANRAAAESGQAAIQNLLSTLNSFNDTKGHWAEQEITDLSNQGIVSGFQDGTFRPNSLVTRAEFVTLVNKLFRFSVPGAAVFSDVQPENWFAAQVSIASQAGYVQGDSLGAFRPNQPLNRAEAAVILSRLVPFLTRTGTDPLSAFGDRSAVPAYSADAFRGAIDAGYMKGFENATIRPGQALTRAEAAALLDRILKQGSADAGQTSAFKAAPKALSEAGTYGPASGETIVAGDVSIQAPGITLQNLTIRGNLTIAESVGEGDVYLQNVIVAGSMIVKGGGPNSIHIDDSSLTSIVVEKVGGRVRVVVGGTTVVEQMDIRSDATVESESSAGIEGITISQAGEVTLSGDFKNIEVKANVKLSVSAGAIEHLTVDAAVTGSTITLDGSVSVTELNLQGGASVKGEGTIQKAIVASANVTFEKQPANVEKSGNAAGQTGNSDAGQGTSPTTSPAATPTPTPSATPTISPTTSPTTSPTASPTTSPTASPTTSPTASPTTSPTASPTTSPTASP